MTSVREPAIPVASKDAAPTAPSSRLPSSVPRWMQLAAVVPAACLTGLGGVALLLAMLGVYRLWLALLIGIPVCVVLCALAMAATATRHPTRRADAAAAVAALVLAAVSLGVYGYHPSQYTFIDADPGSYSSTARWIARDGSLRDDAATGAFKGAPNLQYQTAAVYDMGGGHVEFQFNHLASAAMAVAFGIGGQRALFRLSALAIALALLPLYVLGCRLLRRPWLAVVVAATLAEALPIIWIGRGTYSEPYTILPLLAGLVVLCWLWESPRVGTAVLAGVLVGTTVMARIDGIAYLLPLLPFAAFMWTRRQRAAVAGLLLGAAVPVLVGSIDLRYLSGRYGSDLADQRGALQKALLLMAVVCVVAVALRGRLIRAWSRIVRSRIGVVAGGLATVGFLAGWIVRPMVWTVHSGYSAFIAGLQAQEGVTVDGSRTYSEYTLRWVGWYFGPLVMMLAALGLGVLVWRILSGRGSVAEALLASFLLFAGALYIWNPEVNPFQIWAMRRYVPLVLPGIVLLAGVAIDQAIAVVGRWRPSKSLATVVGGVGAAALLLPTAAATAYDGAIKEQAGFLVVFEAACDQAGSDGVFVVTGAYGGLMTHALRVWCGVPTALLQPAETPTQLQALSQRWADECRRLLVVATPPNSIAKFSSVVGPAVPTPKAVNPRRLERTLLRKPHRYTVEQLYLLIAPVRSTAPVTSSRSCNES